MMHVASPAEMNKGRAFLAIRCQHKKQNMWRKHLDTTASDRMLAKRHETEGSIP